MGCGGGAADAHILNPLEHLGREFLGRLNLYAVGVCRVARLEEHLAVGTLGSADKHNEVKLL